MELRFAEGCRKSKLVSLTSAGRAFSDERIVPAIEAEDRAFCALAPEERTEFLRLARLYTEAIDRELAAFKKGESSR